MIDRQEFNLSKLSHLTEDALASPSNNTTRRSAITKRRTEVRSFRDIAESLIQSFPETGEIQPRPLLDKLTRPVAVKAPGGLYQYRVAQYVDSGEELYRLDTFVLEVSIPDREAPHNLFSVGQEWRFPPLVKIPTVNQTIARNYFGKIASNSEVEDALFAIRGVANLFFNPSNPK